jgi:hypothetical protein
MLVRAKCRDQIVFAQRSSAEMIFEGLGGHCALHARHPPQPETRLRDRARNTPDVPRENESS